MARIILILFLSLVPASAQNRARTTTRMLTPAQIAATANLILVIGDGTASSVYAEADTAKGLAAYNACLVQTKGSSFACGPIRAKAQAEDADTRVRFVMGTFYRGLPRRQTPDSLFATNKLYIVGP